MNKQKLTPREQQVAAFLVQGIQEKEIAGRLRLHPGTVRNHMKTLYRKLDVENHAAAIRALSSGFNMPSSLTGLEAKIFDLAAMGYQSKRSGKHFRLARRW
jgi:DNA-binding CsgD family transcriptional regulator